MLRKLLGIDKKERHYCPYCDCEVGSDEEAIEHARQDLSVPYEYVYKSDDDPLDDAQP